MANKSLLFLSILAFISLRATYGANFDDQCRQFYKGTGFASHPNGRCDNFIFCENYVGTEFACPNSKEFDRCNTYHPCALRETIREDCRCKAGNSDQICRQFPDGTGFAPHPDVRECRKYISCYKFVAHEVSCPSYTEFDRCKISCSYPELVSKNCSCHQ